MLEWLDCEEKRIESIEIGNHYRNVGEVDFRVCVLSVYVRIKSNLNPEHTQKFHHSRKQFEHALFRNRENIVLGKYLNYFSFDFTWKSESRIAVKPKCRCQALR